MTTEYKLQERVVKYVEYRYPEVMFYSDLSGIRLPIGLAVKVKKIQHKKRKWLDIFFPEPRLGFAGLFIELKKSRRDYLTKGGFIRQSEHVQAQWRTIQSLIARGFYADFAGGYDEAIEIINWYFGDDDERTT